MKKPELELSDYEKQEPGAKKITEYFEKRLEYLRVQNDSFDAKPDVRGRIAEIKTLQLKLNPKKHNAV